VVAGSACRTRSALMAKFGPMIMRGGWPSLRIAARIDYQQKGLMLFYLPQTRS
jgi:hypothetical protein